MTADAPRARALYEAPLTVGRTLAAETSAAGFAAIMRLAARETVLLERSGARSLRASEEP